MIIVESDGIEVKRFSRYTYGTEKRSAIKALRYLWNHIGLHIDNEQRYYNVEYDIRATALEIEAEQLRLVNGKTIYKIDGYEIIKK